MSLILTRNANESIVIIDLSGNQVVMTVESIRRGQVRLRYVAPPCCQIWRDELLECEDGKYSLRLKERA